MTARVCHDWSPLKYSSDPIPGDPDQVESAASSYATTADTINEVSDYLANLDGDGQRSDTITALMARSRELSGQLLSVSGRYSETASALRYYAPELRAAQAMADSAISEGAPAESQRKQAASNAQDIYQGWMTTLDPNTAKEFEDSYRMAQQRATAAAHEVSVARNKVEEAIRRRDAAAEHAKSLIESAIVNSPMNDSVLDRFKEVLDKAADILTKVGKWIWDNIDTISLVLSIAAVVVAFIPGLNVIAPVLELLANGASALAKAKAVVGVAQAVVKGATTGDWTGAISLGAASLAGFALGKVGGAIASHTGGIGALANAVMSKGTNDKVAGEAGSLTKKMVKKAITAYNTAPKTGVAGVLSGVVQGSAKAGAVATTYAETVLGRSALKGAEKTLTEFSRGVVTSETKKAVAEFAQDKVEKYVNNTIGDNVVGLFKAGISERLSGNPDTFRVQTQSCGSIQ